MKIKRKDNVVKIKSDAGYTQKNKLLFRMHDTGNGYIGFNPAWTSMTQDNYICIDYSEAQYIYLALKAFGAEEWGNE